MLNGKFLYYKLTNVIGLTQYIRIAFQVKSIVKLCDPFIINITINRTTCEYFLYKDTRPRIGIFVNGQAVQERNKNNIKFTVFSFAIRFFILNLAVGT